MPDLALSDHPLQTDVTTLRDAVVELRGYVMHWTEDRACNLVPTQTSLEHAYKICCRALAETYHV